DHLAGADLEASRDIGNERGVAGLRIERARAHELIEAKLGDLAVSRDIEPAIAAGEQDDGAFRIGGLEQPSANRRAARSDLNDRISASWRRNKPCNRTERKQTMAHKPDPVSLHGLGA